MFLLFLVMYFAFNVLLTRWFVDEAIGTQAFLNRSELCDATIIMTLFGIIIATIDLAWVGLEKLYYLFFNKKEE